MKSAIFYNLEKIISGTKFNFVLKPHHLHNMSSLIMCITFLMILGSFGACKDTVSIEPQKPVVTNSPKSSTGDGKVSVWNTKVMLLNVGGNQCWAADALYQGSPESRGGLTKMSRIVSAADTYQPHIIAFNEICYTQYKKIKVDLVARGYRWAYSTTTTGNACANFDASSTNLGQAMFIKHSTSTPTALVSTIHPLPQGTGLEPREMICTDVTIDGKLVKVCVVHITHHAAYRPQQIATVANLAAGWINSGQRVIIAGDFNAEPQDAEMTPMYSHSGGTGLFQEADESDSCPAPLTACRAGERTFWEVKAFYDPPATPKKIDYIFFSEAHFGNPTGDAKSALPDPITDHNLLQGSAPWQ